MALRRLPLILATVLLAAGAGQSARAATLYLRRLVVAEPSQLTIGDLLLCSEQLPPESVAALNRPVGAAADRMLLLASSWFSQRLSSAIGPDAILVGRRSLVVPGGLAGPGTAILLDRLVEWLESLGGFGSASAEIELVRAPSTALPAGEEPRFELLGAERTSGLLSGTVEVAVRAGSGPADRVSLRVRQEVPSSSPGVRAGEPVLLVLRRGAVTVEMQGKALSTAAVGKRVSVWVADVGRSFTGTANGGGVVDVDSF